MSCRREEQITIEWIPTNKRTFTRMIISQAYIFNISRIFLFFSPIGTNRMSLIFIRVFLQFVLNSGCSIYVKFSWETCVLPAPFAFGNSRHWSRGYVGQNVSWIISFHQQNIYSFESRIVYNILSSTKA